MDHVISYMNAQQLDSLDEFDSAVMPPLMTAATVPVSYLDACGKQFAVIATGGLVQVTGG
jgi:hypothetical protein